MTDPLRSALDALLRSVNIVPLVQEDDDEPAEFYVIPGAAFEDARAALAAAAVPPAGETCLDCGAPARTLWAHKDDRLDDTHMPRVVTPPLAPVWPSGPAAEVITVNGHHYVHVAACPCPQMQVEKLATPPAVETGDWRWSEAIRLSELVRRRLGGIGPTHDLIAPADIGWRATPPATAWPSATPEVVEDMAAALAALSMSETVEKMTWRERGRFVVDTLAALHAPEAGEREEHG